MYPLIFHPIYKERIWGGRRLEEMYGRDLPPDVPIGESWEISDRPDDQSVVANGAFAGRTIQWLMQYFGRELLGDAVSTAAGGRFPLLCKILDARDRLSLQVHPPAAKAASLGGEPKTEMWYIADADPGAELFVGLRGGVTRGEFEAKVRSGAVAECFHRIPVRSGDTMFLPSGRVHAIGAGLVIFEIQQNSDTTYRVFDWNRKGLDGRPRELHLEQSLASIDFDDFEPALVDGRWDTRAALASRPLVQHELFLVDELHAREPASVPLPSGRCRVVAVVNGRVELRGSSHAVSLAAGAFAVVPAAVTDASMTAESGTRALLVTAGA